MSGAFSLDMSGIYTAMRHIYTYCIVSECARFIKIGISNRPIERLSTLQSGSPLKLFLFAVLPRDVEKELHKKYQHLRVRSNNEWFFFSDFILNEFRPIPEPVQIELPLPAQQLLRLINQQCDHQGCNNDIVAGDNFCVMHRNGGRDKWPTNKRCLVMDDNSRNRQCSNWREPDSKLCRKHNLDRKRLGSLFFDEFFTYVDEYAVTT